MSSKKANWKAKFEQQFENLGWAMGRHPWRWLFVSLMIIGALASQLGHLKTDNSIEGYLPKGADVIQKYVEFKEKFGRDDNFVITIETKDPYTQKFATQLHKLQRQLLDEVPFIGKVESLANARYTHGANDTLYVDELLPETLPKDPAKVQALKNYALHNENYRNFLISADGHLVAMVVRLNAFQYVQDGKGGLKREYLNEDEMNVACKKIQSIIDQYKGVMSNDIELTGGMPISLELGTLTQKDFTVLSGLANLIIGILLFVFFRRASGVVIPLLIMLLSVVVTMSLMAIGGTPMQVTTSILPAFLLAVCVGDSIHLLTIFYRHYDEGDEKIHALAKAMGHCGLAMFFTSITTAAGLVSFAFSGLTLVAALGIYGSLGTMVALFLTISILPCFIALVPIKRRPIHHEEHKGLMHRFLTWSINFSSRYAKPIVVVSVVLLVASAVIASKTRFSHYPLGWLPHKNPYVVAIKKYEKRMGSTISIEVLLDTGKDRGILNPGFLRAMDTLQKEVVTWNTDHYKIAKAISVNNIIKETNRALHDNDNAQYSIPDDPKLISQELFMVEMDQPDDVYNTVDKDYRVARLTITSNWFDGVYMQPLLEKLRGRLNELMKPYNVKVSITGLAPIMGVTFGKMLISSAESYGLAGVVISLMMVLLIGDVKLGLLSMIPSLLPILMVVAIMHLVGVPMDMLTMLVGSIAMGLTVDDNIHFMHGFRRLYLKTGDPFYAVKHTMMSTGRAMLATSVVLSLGFLVYTQAQMVIMVGFGIITAGCIALALLASYLLGPALMILTNKTWHHHEEPEAEAEVKKVEAIPADAQVEPVN